MQSRGVWTTFEDLSGWMPVASGLAELRISPERGPAGAAMRLDFDFKGGGGFVVARKPIARPMPESYALSFAIRGDGAAEPARAQARRPERPERLVAPLGRVRASRRLADDAASAAREIEFAWGPAGGGRARASSAPIELAIAAGPGGAGTVWIGDLRLEDRTYRATPMVRASSARPGHARRRPRSTATRRRAGGATPARAASARGRLPARSASTAASSSTGQPGARAARVPRRDVDRRRRVDDACTRPSAADVERSYIYLPGAASRYLRLDLEAATADGCGIAELAVQPFEFSRSINAFFEQRRRAASRAAVIRAGSPASRLLDAGRRARRRHLRDHERGGHGRGRPRHVLDRAVPATSTAACVTWADADDRADARGRLAADPVVGLARATSSRCATTAFAAGATGAPILFLRYRVESTARAAAARPALRRDPAVPGEPALAGVRRARRRAPRSATLAWDGARASASTATRVVVPLDRADGFGAAPFEQGDVTTYLARGELPPRAARRRRVRLRLRRARVRSRPRAGRGARRLPRGPVRRGGRADASAARRHRAAPRRSTPRVRDWRERLGARRARRCRRRARDARRHGAHGGGARARRTATARRCSRARAATRASWIRDGAIMAAALLRVGRARRGRRVRPLVRDVPGAPTATCPCSSIATGPTGSSSTTATAS